MLVGFIKKDFLNPAAGHSMTGIPPAVGFFAAPLGTSGGAAWFLFGGWVL